MYEQGQLVDHSVEVVVSFRSDFTIPPFPAPNEAESRESPGNALVLSESARLIDAISTVRTNDYDDLTARLRSSFGAVEKERFWLISAMRMELPLSSIRRLSEDADVTHVEPDYTGSVPGQANIIDGRAAIQSDPYFGFNQGWIGLLDTGVRSTHARLSSPNVLGFTVDCFNGTSSSLCMSGSNLNPDDDCFNHGTGVAAILSGNNSVAASRGVTGMVLDSLKIWPAGCGGDTVSSLTRGFQAAVGMGDRVIVTTTGVPNDSYNSGRPQAADAAFDAQAVVLASAGNFGPGGSSVGSPALAHKVLAVGAVHVVGGALEGYSSRGPTVDSRIKPDLLAPSQSWTASTTSNSAMFPFAGTSFSAPYGAGGAALVRNWLRGSNSTIDPGQVNAFLIMTGNTPAFDNNVGSGLMKLPANGHAWWGVVSLQNGQVVDIPLSPVVSPSSAINAALWWPELNTQTHSRISLKLIRPDGGTVTSDHTTSVFQKVRMAPVTQFIWPGYKLRVTALSVAASTQTVYWAAFRQF